MGISVFTIINLFAAIPNMVFICFNIASLIIFGILIWLYLSRSFQKQTVQLTVDTAREFLDYDDEIGLVDDNKFRYLDSLQIRNDAAMVSHLRVALYGGAELFLDTTMVRYAIMNFQMTNINAMLSLFLSIFPSEKRLFNTIFAQLELTPTLNLLKGAPFIKLLMDPENRTNVSVQRLILESIKTSNPNDIRLISELKILFENIHPQVKAQDIDKAILGHKGRIKPIIAEISVETKNVLTFSRLKVKNMEFDSPGLAIEV
jgi:hypothetical protein